MAIKVGINGFGRIGRVVARICLQNSDLELSAINDPALSVEYINYLLKFDSTHGKLHGNVTNTNDTIIVDDHSIKVFHEKLPSNIPWRSADVQYVVEASGMFTNQEKASGHLASTSVKRVIVTSPSADVPMIIIGVNDHKLPIEQKVMSCASSTLYCLAPIIKILEDNFGVSEGFITSIHAMTPSLKPLDGLCLRGRHWRDHRSINQNIIPATTNACKALGKIIPKLKDKLSGMAFRVPIVNVSVLDLTVRLKTNTSMADIVKCVETAGENNMKYIVKISSDATVSSDFIGESHSCILDADSSIQLKPDFFKIICWYENEYSYACRVADSIFFSETQYSTLSSKLTFVKPRFLLIQEEVQQTESYKKEMSVSCCDTGACSVYKLPFELGPDDKAPCNQVVKRSLPNSSSHSLPMCYVRHDIPPWEDIDLNKPVETQNKSSSPTPATDVLKHVCRVDNIKRELKMGYTPEEFLKKSRSNHVTFSDSFKNELTKKSDQFRIRDKFFLPDTESLKVKNEPVEICGDGKALILFPGLQEKVKSRLQTSTRIIANHKARSMLITKYRKEKENLMKQAAAQGAFQGKRNCYPMEDVDNVNDKITSLVERLAKNHRVQYLYDCSNSTFRGSNKFELSNKTIQENLHNTSKLVNLDTNDDNKDQTIDRKECNEKLEHRVDKDQTIDRKECNEKLEHRVDKDQTIDRKECNEKLEHRVDKDQTIDRKECDENLEHRVDKHVKLNDEELKKLNMIPINVSSVINKYSDENIDLSLKPRKLPTDFKRKLVEPVFSTEMKNAFLASSETASACDSLFTNTTISNRNERKRDLYDKLDSASGSESNASFEISQRQSQIINMSDLTTSMEDLGRLDKICRIIEISDELSDKLFSKLNDTEIDTRKKNKKWSFRDLCDRIHLDEFCEKVFGKYAANNF